MIYNKSFFSVHRGSFTPNTCLNIVHTLLSENTGVYLITTALSLCILTTEMTEVVEIVA